MFERLTQKEIKMAAINNLHHGIISVLRGAEKEFSSNIVCIDDVLDYLEKHFDVNCHDYDLETNGWQADYWVDVNVNNKKYTVRACGYYGTVNFSVNEE